MADAAIVAFALPFPYKHQKRTKAFLTEWKMEIAPHHHHLQEDVQWIYFCLSFYIDRRGSRPATASCEFCGFGTASRVFGARIFSALLLID